MSHDIKLVPTLTVFVFGNHVITEVMPPVSKREQGQRRYRVRRATKFLREFLKREPIIADLTPENLQALAASLKGKRNTTRFIEFLGALRKVAVKAGVVNKADTPSGELHPLRGGGRFTIERKPVQLESTDEVVLSKTTPVVVFGTMYVRKVLPELSDRKRCSDRVWKIRSVCRFYRDHLQREPTIGDLTRERIIGFLETMKGRPQFANCRDVLRTMRKQAILHDLIPGGPGKALLSETDGRGLRSGRRSTAAPLSGEEGSLWWWCTTKYFKANHNIRSDQTRAIYKYTLVNFRESIGREPTLEDLSDDNCAAMMSHLLQLGKAARTVNERRARLHAFWTWLAKRNVVKVFPTLGKVREPHRIPVAWTREEMERLFAACREMPGRIAGVPANLWWEALHFVGWNTAERIGALLKARWEHVDFDRGILSLPAEIRKGGTSDARYPLHPNTLALLKQMLYSREITASAGGDASAGEGQGRIFHWPYVGSYFNLRYKAVLKRAGLPHGPGIGFHRMRKSVASHLHAGGRNASEALGHSSSAVTQKSYLDPSISGQTSPSQLLFQPGAKPDVKPAEQPPVKPKENLPENPVEGWEIWF